MPVAAARALRLGGALLAVALLLLAPAARAEAAQPELVMHVYQLQHQSASEAMGIVVPLLSSRGTVQVRPGDNTLVVRDTVDALQKIMPIIYSFDHPSRSVDIQLWLVRATVTGGVSPEPPPPPLKPLPADLVGSLRKSFHYQEYALVGSSSVSALEGEKVTFEVAKDFIVRFRLGTVVGEQRLRLSDFEVMLETATGAPQSLLKSQLNLWLQRTMAMGLTAGQDSGTALLVVVRCEPSKTKVARRGQR